MNSMWAVHFDSMWKWNPSHDGWTSSWQPRRPRHLRTPRPDEFHNFIPELRERAAENLDGALFDAYAIGRDRRFAAAWWHK